MQLNRQKLYVFNKLDIITINQPNNKSGHRDSRRGCKDLHLDHIIKAYLDYIPIEIFHLGYA
jgi:hypothetical protein